MHKKRIGTVIKGLGMGKEFGFPTINIDLIDSDLQIPNGVYAVLLTLCKDSECENFPYKGMLYVGTRPTLGLQKITIEIHVFDFNEDVYEQQISFQILHKIRDEIRFESVEKLIKQLHQDKKMVYEYFDG